MNAESLLIVEDDESLRLIMQMQLDRLGYITAAAVDAEQALEIIRRSHQNLVITDLQLPGMSGIELLKRIHTDFPGIPVIVVTAFGSRVQDAGPHILVLERFHLDPMNAVKDRRLLLLDRCGQALDDLLL